MEILGSRNLKPISTPPVAHVFVKGFLFCFTLQETVIFSRQRLAPYVADATNVMRHSGWNTNTWEVTTFVLTLLFLFSEDQTSGQSSGLFLV